MLFLHSNNWQENLRIYAYCNQTRETNTELHSNREISRTRKTYKGLRADPHTLLTARSPKFLLTAHRLPGNLTVPCGSEAEGSSRYAAGSTGEHHQQWLPLRLPGLPPCPSPRRLLSASVLHCQFYWGPALRARSQDKVLASFCHTGLTADLKTPTYSSTRTDTPIFFISQAYLSFLNYTCVIKISFWKKQTNKQIL